MKEYPIEKKRNVALIAHNGVGKTTLTESMLYCKGIVNRRGRVEDGNTFSDYTDEEKNRQISIHTSLINIDHNGTRLNLLDCPGFMDFAGEIKGSVRISGGILLVVCATAGVEVGTEKAWEIATEYNKPAVAFINRMDRERADFEKALNSMNEILDVPSVAVQLPIGKEADFKGVVDLVKMKAIYFKENGSIEKEEDIPGDLADTAQTFREALIDRVAEADDELMMKYLDGEELSNEEITKAILLGTRSRSFIPVLCGSASNGIGIAALMDALNNLIPTPNEIGEFTIPALKGEEKITVKPDPNGPLCALLFKTTVDPYAGKLSFFRIYSGTMSANGNVYISNKDMSLKIGNILSINGKQTNNIAHATVGDICALSKIDDLETNDTIASESLGGAFKPTYLPPPCVTMAIETPSKADDEKLGNFLPRLIEEDPTLSLKRDTETKQTVISGQGDLHLEVALSRLKDRYGINTELVTPKVPYKETITAQNEGSYRHKKQSGGRGQFGEVHLRLKPLKRGEGFKFVDSIVGGAIPGKFIPAVEKGLAEAMNNGMLAGFKVVDVEVELFFGKFHDVDSSEIAFKIAGSMGFKQVALTCKPILLEPIMNVKIKVPEEYMGAVIGDVNSKRGRILGMEPDGKFQRVNAQVPLSEMFRYYADLRSIARGRGSYEMEVAHFEPVPNEITEKIVAQIKKEKEEE